MHIEQSTVGSGWVSVNTPAANVGQVHVNVSPKTPLTTTTFYFTSRSIQIHSIQPVPNFRVHSSRLAEFLPCGTRTKGTSIKEAQANRGKVKSARAPWGSSCKTFAVFTAALLLCTEPSARVLIHRSHVKISALNFGRVVVVSLGPPYFHTQGGLVKYVGVATSDVTVRAWASTEGPELFL